jgi:hypothetical protein
MNANSLHHKIAQLRQDERRRVARAPEEPFTPPGRLASELAPVISLVAGFATLLMIAAPSL